MDGLVLWIGRTNPEWNGRVLAEFTDGSRGGGVVVASLYTGIKIISMVMIKLE